ncbi:MAG: 30S ribosomal protein S17 [Candidatus Omnitrophota bacterium]|nr:MAG: 30S ribosomal protein S17 [Candidatus Omnitrophota bacterium]
MRKLIGTIVSDKMDKTRVVAVAHVRAHPRYKKRIKITRRLKAHDENNEYKTGDRVVMEETRPMSKDKRWKIVGKLTADR